MSFRYIILIIFFVLSACAFLNPKKQSSLEMIWAASSTIELSEKFIVIDQGEKQKIHCSHKKKRGYYGKLQIGSESVNLFCYDEYLGGWYDSLGSEAINMAQEDADAGDSWSGQTFFYKEAGRLWAQRQSYQVSENTECPVDYDMMKRLKLSEKQKKKWIENCKNPISCHRKTQSFVYKDGHFIKVSKREISYPFKIPPHEYYRERCQ